MRKIPSGRFCLIFLCLLSQASLADNHFEIEMRIENVPKGSKRLWAQWSYSADRRDYNGKEKPRGFTRMPDGAYKRGSVGPFPNQVPAEMIMGKKSGNKISYNETDVFNSAIILAEAKGFFSSTKGISGAILEKGKFYLYGEKGHSEYNPLPEDIFVCLNAVYRSGSLGAYVAIDPSGKNSATGVLRFGGQVEDSHVGQVLFECDRLMKCIGLGYSNLSGNAIHVSQFKWHKSKLDFRTFEENKPEKWHQFWMGTEDMIVNVDNTVGMLAFGEDRFVVKTQRVKIKGARYEPYFSEGEKGPTGKFVDHFNQNFHRYAKEYAVLKEMTGIAKLIAIFRWAYERGVMIDIKESKLRPFYGRYTPIKTPIITVKKIRKEKGLKEFKKYFREDFIGSVGGMDLQKYNFKKKDLKHYKSELLKSGKYVIYRLL